MIGTHRLLRVVDDRGETFNDIDKLPTPLADSLQPYRGNLNALFGRSVYARYTVCAFTRSRPGVMQSVIVKDASDVRIVDDHM